MFSLKNKTVFLTGSTGGIGKEIAFQMSSLGAKLLPVLKFTKVDDAKSDVEITQDAVVTVISCIQK